MVVLGVTAVMEVMLWLIHPKSLPKIQVLQVSEVLLVRQAMQAHLAA